jgi:hypothetical protein
MFTFNFGIKNPFSKRFQSIVTKHGAVTKNKSWELQLSKTNDILGIEISFTTRQSHSGVYLSLALFGYELIFNIHDNRHWDYLTNTYEIYEEIKNGNNR